MSEVLVVFTKESIEDIREQRGTASWRLDDERARQCIYALCTRNSRPNQRGNRQPHGSAFLLGKIRGVTLSTDPKYRKRRLVQFSKFIEFPTPIPNAWPKHQNPIGYIGLDELVAILSRSRWKPT